MIRGRIGVFVMRRHRISKPVDFGETKDAVHFFHFTSMFRHSWKLRLSPRTWARNGKISFDVLGRLQHNNLASFVGILSNSQQSAPHFSNFPHDIAPYRLVRSARFIEYLL